MTHLDPTTREQITRILLPHMQGEADRRTLVDKLFLDVSDAPQIPIDGDPYVVTQNLVDALAEMGDLDINKPALWSLLMLVRESAESDVQSQIGTLEKLLLNTTSEANTLDSMYEACSACIQQNPKDTLICEDPCYPLLQQALSSNAEDAWTYFYRAFEPWITSRARGYCFRYSLSDTLVDHFVNVTYFRFWRSLHGKSHKIKDFRHALNYLRTCARSTVLDSIKSSTETNAQELDAERLVAAPTQTNDFDQLWQLVLETFEDAKDQLLVHCYIIQDLKPREILEAYAEHWQSTDEIKVDWQRIRRQLRRNYRVRQWFDIDNTI